jgi:ATP-binding cassette, subfamily B, bacterial
VRERGRHEELLAAGGLYAELYHTQFASQEARQAPLNGEIAVTKECVSRPTDSGYAVM